MMVVRDFIAGFYHLKTRGIGKICDGEHIEDEGTNKSRIFFWFDLFFPLVLCYAFAAGHEGTPHRFRLGHVAGISAAAFEPFVITAPGADINLVRSVESQLGHAAVALVVLSSISLFSSHWLHLYS